jgi:hypothetical protein
MEFKVRRVMQLRRQMASPASTLPAPAIARKPTAHFPLLAAGSWHVADFHSPVLQKGVRYLSPDGLYALARADSWGARERTVVFRDLHEVLGALCRIRLGCRLTMHVPFHVQAIAPLLSGRAHRNE